METSRNKADGGQMAQSNCRHLAADAAELTIDQTCLSAPADQPYHGRATADAGCESVVRAV